MYGQRLVQDPVELLVLREANRILSSALVGSYGERNLSSQHWKTNCSIDAERGAYTVANTADAITVQSC